MNKIIKKVGMIVMAMSVFGISACAKINEDTAEKVTDKLSEKYGCEFKAEYIGDRLNRTTARLYIHPVENPEIIFSATTNKDNSNVVDDYIQEIVAHNFDVVIAECMEEYQIECVVNTVMMRSVDDNETNTNMSIAEYKEKYPKNGNLVYVFFDENKINESFVDDFTNALKKASAETQYKLVVAGFVLESESYAECCNEIKEYPKLEPDSYNVKAEFGGFVDGETTSLSFDEVTEILNGGE